MTHPELQECNQSSSFGTMTSSVMINTQTVNFIISWYMIQKQQNTQAIRKKKYEVCILVLGAPREDRSAIVKDGLEGDFRVFICKKGR